MTDNHPIWSHDRNEWIEASSLKIDELIRTHSGFTKLIRKQKLKGTYTVYNIEVYRSHNYFASKGRVLAHNGPCGIDFNTRYWVLLAEQTFYNIRYLTNRYLANMAPQKVGDEYNVVIYYIRSINTDNPPGSYTAAMELVVNEARESGAKRIHLMIGNVTNPDMHGYYSNIEKKFKGFRVNTDGTNYGLIGDLDEIERIPSPIPEPTEP